jgi:endonuclease G
LILNWIALRLNGRGAGIRTPHRRSASAVLVPALAGLAMAACVSGAPDHGDLRDCAEFFPGKQIVDVPALDKQLLARGLCFDAFAVVHSGRSKTPVLVVERLNRSQLIDAEDEKRADKFFADARLPQAHRAQLEDYKGSGFDRGHMAPAGDMPSPPAMAQSFSLANIVPQDRRNNQRIWSKIEADTRKYARRAEGDVFVFTGPIFDGKPQSIGPNQVWVPSRLFKLVYDEKTGRSWAHIVANQPDVRVGRPVTYADFVQETGWKLLPERR